MQAIPVFADDSTKSKIDFDNGASCILRTESQIYYTEYSYDDIVVPVYMNLQGISGENLYYSGYIYGSYTAFNFVDSSSNRYVISYFESANENIRTTYFRTNNFWNIYLDNVVISNNNTTLIGYLHLMGNEQNPTLTLNCNNALQTMNVTAHNLYCTGYEFGFVNSMVYALDNSANLDGMYDILDHIESASLPEILTTIQTNHTALYNLINSVWLTDQSVLSVSQQTYNTVLSILNILNHIDDTLDNISWKSISNFENGYYNFPDNTFYTFSGALNRVNDFYFKFNPPITKDNIYFITLPFMIQNRDNYKLDDILSDFKFTIFSDYGGNLDIPIEDIFISCNRYNIYLYFRIPAFYIDYNTYLHLNIPSGYKYYLYSYSYSENISFSYIDSSDIEYWKIYSALKTGKIEKILSDQYKSQVNQADAIKDEVDTNLQNLADDIIVEKPSAVANIADDYIEQVDTSHNYQVFSWLTAPTFVLMMAIVAGLAVISYMLYGGQ